MCTYMGVCGCCTLSFSLSRSPLSLSGCLSFFSPSSGTSVKPFREAKSKIGPGGAS